MRIKRISYYILSRCFGMLKRGFYHIIINYQKTMMPQCGNNVTIENHCEGHWNNIFCGEDIHIGKNNLFMCAIAPIKIGDHVMFGPNVTVITGDHRVDIVGRYMTSVRNEEKLPENDQPVVFEGDNWIGANTTILKGVVVGKGAIVASGAVVNKDVPPYSVVGGIPAKVIKYRFTEEQLSEHRKKLRKTIKSDMRV
ncbi:MAG: hypothetical protein PHX08_20670 [Lachnospiraceae bacterium]|nr:hypothetical protein [Lachnospiraceae bacterium]